MAITFAWSFPSLDVIYSMDGHDNVVQAVHWVYVGTDGMIYEQTVGCTPLPSPKGSFISYSDLTPEIVQNWVVETLGQDAVDEMTAEIQQRIAAKATPKGRSEAPPWG